MNIQFSIVLYNLANNENIMALQQLTFTKAILDLQTKQKLNQHMPEYLGGPSLALHWHRDIDGRRP